MVVTVMIKTEMTKAVLHIMKGKVRILCTKNIKFYHLKVNIIYFSIYFWILKLFTEQSFNIYKNIFSGYTVCQRRNCKIKVWGKRANFMKHSSTKNNSLK